MIIGKIVEIIDNRTAAINVGSKDGVRVGMVFQIFAKDGREVIDPDTGEKLGSLKFPKMKIKVTYVASDKLSLAETFEYEKVNIGGINTLQGFSNIFAPPNYVKKYKTFEVAQEQKKKIEEEKSSVKVGDIVELIDDEQA